MCGGRNYLGVRTPERVIVWAWGRLAVALRLWRAVRGQAFVCEAQLAQIVGVRHDSAVGRTYQSERYLA